MLENCSLLDLPYASRPWKAEHEQNFVVNESRIKTVLPVLPVISVLSAGLYLFGTTYLQGYLNAFGIDDSMFPNSIDRLLFSGFAALVTFGVVPFVYAFLAMLALVAAVLIAAVLSSLPRVQKRQDTLLSKLRSMQSSRRPSPAVTAMLDKSERSTSMVSVYLRSDYSFCCSLSCHLEQEKNKPNVMPKNFQKAKATTFSC
jgi:hypothetical protein